MTQIFHIFSHMLSDKHHLEVLMNMITYSHITFKWNIATSAHSHAHSPQWMWAISSYGFQTSVSAPFRHIPVLIHLISQAAGVGVGKA